MRVLLHSLMMMEDNQKFPFSLGYFTTTPIAQNPQCRTQKLTFKLFEEIDSITNNNIMS